MTVKFSPIDTAARTKLDFKSGDTLRVWTKIPEEKGKFRLQAFEGLVLARKHGNTGSNATFTVRKISNSVGVERIFPLFSPIIDKIEILKKSKTRRSKLYFIREKAAKEIRKKMKSILMKGEAEPEEETSNA
jgi:large subunit ribosomal protein L19